MQPATYDTHSVHTTTTWIAGLVALLVALVLPLGYYVVSYQYLIGGLEAESEITGAIIGKLINSNPDMWVFEQTRIEALLEQRRLAKHSETRKIYDLSSILVAESNAGLKPPLISRKTPLMESGMHVGTLEIQISQLPILLNSGLAALLGGFCSFLIFTALRTFPLRAVAQAEKSLRDSELRYRSLVENAPDAILVYGKDTILYANHAATALFKAQTREQLIGQPVATICKSDHSALEGKCLQMSVNADNGDTGSSQMEMRLTRLDGSSVEVAVVGIGTTFNEEPAVQVILHDVTERKMLLDELQDKIMLLEAARANVKHLEGIIPICMYCKKIRDDRESWQQMESYISDHSEALFSHGICPECFPKAKNEAMREWE